MAFQPTGTVVDPNRKRWTFFFKNENIVTFAGVLRRKSPASSRRWMPRATLRPRSPCTASLITMSSTSSATSSFAKVNNLCPLRYVNLTNFIDSFGSFLADTDDN